MEIQYGVDTEKLGTEVIIFKSPERDFTYISEEKVVNIVNKYIKHCVDKGYIIITPEYDENFQKILKDIESYEKK